MKTKSTIILAEIAIMAALAFALDALQGGIWRGVFANGGSIGIAMLPILIMSYRRGFFEGFLTALILSFIQMLGGVYAIADTWYMVMLQILLDYIIAYPLVAFAGFFFNQFKEGNREKQITYLIVGSVLGGLLKFLSHYLAGVIFWGSNCPNGFIGGPAIFSLVYNGEYMLPNIIINTSLLLLIYFRAPQILLINKMQGDGINEKNISKL